MRPHIGLFVSLALVLAAVSGCGPEKEIPREVTLSPEQEVPDGPPAPAQSDPDAKAFIEKCLAAATEGHPERLARVKSNKSSVVGLWRNSGGELISTTREIQASWPDKFLVSLEFGTGDVKAITLGLRRPQIWKRQKFADSREEFPSSHQEEAEILRVDALGQHWFPLLFPLTQNETVVFDLKKQSIAGVETMTVKASIPDCPVFTLWFNSKNSLLGLITYTHVEFGSKFHKQVTLDAHKPQGGLVLPMKLEVARNSVVVENWTVTSWEFPEKVDEAVFDPPK